MSESIDSRTGLEEARKLADTSLCVACGRTGVGGRKENQDSYGGERKGECVVLTVCDGMGGMNGGRTASNIARLEIVQTALDVPSEEWNTDTALAAAERANAAVYRRACDEPALRGMGTTATILLLTPEAAYVGHVGDSRVYQLRKGKKVFRTFDHSKVFEMVAQKMMTEEQARQSSFSNIITRALGIRPSMEMDVVKLPYKKGDRFILCCDGIWNTLPESEMIDLFNKNEQTEAAVTELAETVNHIGISEGGEHDNLTVVIADMKADSAYQENGFRVLTRTLAGFCKKIFGK